jgi:hypothetical protein
VPPVAANPAPDSVRTLARDDRVNLGQACLRVDAEGFSQQAASIAVLTARTRALQHNPKTAAYGAARAHCLTLSYPGAYPSRR